LGYDINCKDRDAEEILRRRRELYSRANLLKSRFGGCSRPVKLYLFKTFFSSIYCASLWAPVNKSIMNQVRVAYNDSFRILMGYSRRFSASRMFAENNINDFEAVRRTAAYSLLQRLANSENSILNAMLSSKVFTQSSITMSWKQLLFSES